MALYVTLVFENGREFSSSGPCFGFTGKSGKPCWLSNNYKNLDVLCTEYKYHLGEHIDTRSRALLSKKELRHYVDWLSTESVWSRYTKSIEYPHDNLNDCKVVLDPKYSGTSIVGTGSVYRLAKHKPEHLEEWYKWVTLGVEPHLALFMLYMLPIRVMNNKTFKLCDINPEYEFQDDTPFKLDRLDIQDVYSIIRKDWGFIQKDNGDDVYSYRDTLRYDQDILKSYRSNKPVGKIINLGDYITKRFGLPFTSNNIVKSTSSGRGGMGSSYSSSYYVEQSNTISLGFYMGIGLQLTEEFKTQNKFLSVYSDKKNNGVL